MSMERRTFILILTIVLYNAAIPQTHYSSVSNTGNNAIIAIPVSINPTVDGNSLEVNDEIAVYADGRLMPDSFCVGVAKWTKQSTAITVWGDNEQTSALDGIRSGTKFYFHVWKSSANKEYTNAKVAFTQGDSLYRTNGVYIIAALSAGSNQGTPSIISEPAINNMPMRFVLQQNYPNPFNPTTVISYELPVMSSVKIVACDILGREVAVLVNEPKGPGKYFITWEAAGFSSGTYFYRISAMSLTNSTILFSATKKLLLVR
jgi:hypothetical protein